MDTGSIMGNQLFQMQDSFEHQLKENADLGLKNYSVWYRVDRRNEGIYHSITTTTSTLT